MYAYLLYSGFVYRYVQAFFLYQNVYLSDARVSKNWVLEPILEVFDPMEICDTVEYSIVMLTANVSNLMIYT